MPRPEQIASEPPAVSRNRRTALAALVGIAGTCAPAVAQMGGGGGGGGRGGHQSEGGCPDKSRGDSHPPEASPPRDLAATFAKRLKEGVPDLAVDRRQDQAFRDFVDSLSEVGQHNERRLQRILWLTTSTVSATAPLTAFIDSEVREGEDRQQALQELKLARGRLDAVLDERQRAVLANLFVATRSELQAARQR